MAVSKVSISPGSQLEKTYRSWIHGSGYPYEEINVILHGTVVILRRHSIHGTICSDCGNDDPDHCQTTDVDKLGFITELQCLVCGKHLSTTCQKSKYYYERISDPSVLERGDHVGWYRAFAYWHHAIVTGQYADRIAVVGYTPSKTEPCAKVIEKKYRHRSMSSLLRGSVYRIVHDDCYTNEYTALRAERTIGEEKYDFFEQNCEHSTIWCKTGLHGSDQIQSGFTSLTKVALGIFLRVAVLAVLWLLQISRLTEGSTAAADQLWVRRGVNIAYMSLIVIVFWMHSVYKGCTTMKSFVKPSGREPHDDLIESCRKNCSNEFFRCCCRRNPSCSRLACSICCVACFCCSLCEVTCSFCARNLRHCSIPCCGRPVFAVIRLIIRSFIRELIAASGAFLVVWYMDDIVPYFEGRHVILSTNPLVNRAIIVIVAIVIVSLVTYPVGVLVSRWVEGLTECCCCPCSYPSNRAEYKHEECADQPCPVHDEIVSIPAPYGDYLVTNIPIEQSENQCSAVIQL